MMLPTRAAMMIPNTMRGATFDMFSTKVRFEADMGSLLARRLLGA